MSPEQELTRAREFSQGLVELVASLAPSRRADLLSKADGRRCPTCACRMVYFRGERFGHERPNAATVEHINPRKLGGSNELWNLIARCNLCNRASGQAMNEWLQRHDHNPPWDEEKRMINYLWVEVHDTSKAQELYPDLYASFLKKRESMATKINVKGGERIAKRNGNGGKPSTTGNKSGKGRSNSPPRKK